MSSFRSTSQRISVLAALAASGALLVACDADPIGGGTTGSGGSGAGDSSSVVTTSTSSSDVGTSSSSQGTGGQGEGGFGAGGGNATGGAPAVNESIALYGDEIPETEPGDSTSVGVGGGDGGFEPDRLYLFVSDGPTACSDPFFVDEGCAEDVFKAIIGLPPEYQQPGVYDLDDPAIISNFSQWAPDGDGTCNGGGGSFWGGTIEVVSIEADRVRVILAGTDTGRLDGPQTVHFCSGGPPVEDSAVIAYFPSDLPDGESGSSAVTTGTSGGEEEMFHIKFADYGQSCADPSGPTPVGDEVHHEFIVAIPAEYLTPGTYSLDDPSIVTSYWQMESNTAAVSGGGADRPGTLTILEVTADALQIELTGSQHDFANGGGLVPRCGG